MTTLVEKKRAQRRAQYAVKTGRLVAEPCVLCGSKAEAHHEDYSKPLDVIWLCRIHHYWWHRGER